VNKNELVHYHALLARVAEDYVDRGVATRNDLAAYRALGTTPLALRQSRADHEEATLLLARTLAALSTGASSTSDTSDTSDTPDESGRPDRRLEGPTRA
jgi:hypothetical protein